MKTPKKVLVIGMDALTPELVERWTEDASLPTIRRFLEEGAWGRMRSVPNRNSAPAWSSMVTGLNPGKHGVFYWTDEDPTTYSFRFINGSFRRGDAVWKVLSNEGRRVVVMNVPLSFPAEEVNGCFVSGLDAPSVDDPRFTHPSDLRHTLRETTGGEYQVHSGHALLADPAQVDAGIERVHRSIDARAAAATHLIDQQPWDFFMVVFTESDVIQHFFWRQMEDPSPSDPPHHVSAIKDVYEHLDRVARDLMERVDDDTLVVLVSDHGARGDDGLARSLPNWLHQLGYLNYVEDDDGHTRSIRSLGRRLITKAYHAADARLSSEMKHRLAQRLPGVRRRVEATMSYSKIDWSRTRAYTDGKRPEIWVNLKGRQSHGIVDPEDHDAFVDELISSLTSATCAGTGASVVRAARRRDEAYTGPYVERSPDLVLEWEEKDVCLDLVYPDGRRFTIGKDHLEDDPMNRAISGGHAQDGIVGFLGAGAGRGRIADCDITDFAPTVLLALDAPIPADSDGRVLVEALSDELAARVVRQGAATTDDPDAEVTGYSAEEEAEMHDRLQSLGYVE